MTLPFTRAFRREIADRCAFFPRQAAESGTLKRAAVAVVLVEADDGSGETALLLTRRAASLRAHAGQWALPGGRCDPGETSEAAARRELGEELGVALRSEDVLGVLDDYETRSGYVIAPVVCWLPDAGAIQPNPAEVASVHHIRLDRLAQPDALAFIAIAESPRPVIRLNIGDHSIHAPTAALMHQAVELAQGRVTRVAHYEQPVWAWR